MNKALTLQEMKEFMALHAYGTAEFMQNPEAQRILKTMHPNITTEKIKATMEKVAALMEAFLRSQLTEADTDKLNTVIAAGAAIIMTKQKKGEPIPFFAKDLDMQQFNERIMKRLGHWFDYQTSLETPATQQDNQPTKDFYNVGQ